MKRCTGWTGCALLLALTLGTSLAGAGDGTFTVNGSVRALANKSKTIAVDQPNKPALVVRFNEKTAFQNATGTKDILPGENVSIDYQHDGDDNLATRITKVIPKLPAGVPDLPVADVEALLAPRSRTDYLLIDARPASKYAAGHLPTAISIPLSTLEQQGAKLLPPKKDTLLVFYCGGVSCGLSHKSAQIARGLGYTNVKVFTAGEPGWKKAEHYTVPSAAFLKDGNVILVDLRAPKAAAAGHLPGAVNIPLAQLESWENRFPSTKSAQVVFYGDKESAIVAAVSTARDWGFTNVTGFPGAVKEWQQAGFKLSQGATADRIVWQKKLGPNEVGSTEFPKFLSAGTLLVDVRTPDEYAKEHITSAINIPTEQMAKRYVELPNEKPVLFYCSTGARAEMAFDLVKGKAYAVKFLNANVEFKEDGSYKVSE